MKGYERDKVRRELDEALLPFRLVRKRKAGGAGWLRSIRQAVGIPVDEVARRMGVCRWEVHRLEESEANARIMLASLSKAAKGLGCELVYALIPKDGTLEDLAAEQREVRKDAAETRREKREARRQPFLEEIGWREKMLRHFRTMLRREGFRVRPRTTERGVAKQTAEFEEAKRRIKMDGRRMRD